MLYQQTCVFPAIYDSIWVCDEYPLIDMQYSKCTHSVSLFRNPRPSSNPEQDVFYRMVHN
jgi:hypothetical protein